MLRQMFTMEYLKSMAYVIVAMLIAISVHELAHGYVSYKLGDPTPKKDGRLSLNPFVHLDFWGTICLIFFRVGWAKPVRINTSYYKNKKKGIILVSLAGPLMNYVLAFVSLLLCFLCIERQNFLGVWLYYVAVLNVGLGTFNLIPVPPLDGSNILMEICPKVAYWYGKFRKYARIILAVCLISGILSKPLQLINAEIIDWMWKLIVKIFWKDPAMTI